ncbi:MAG: putative nucleic acid-binding protein contains domain, partial [Caulobacteraceae bacterium]|nr:putative nucleic acid-binding protein contains domain [Caulobacteraceae bacterium]
AYRAGERATPRTPRRVGAPADGHRAAPQRGPVILVDTSVWVDHLRRGNPALAERLAGAEVLIHPFVLGEIALGNLARREVIIGSLARLPKATVASDAEVMRLIDAARLHGRGIGYVDAHLLAAARLSAARVWTLDKQLASVAKTLALTHI